MLKEDDLLGTISIFRQEVRPFTDRQIELVQSFAAQAVIAIENTRLLSELKQSLEQQTATSEVLQVISSSPGDLQPVFAAMLEKAVRICDASFGNIYRWDGGVFSLAASLNTPTAFAEYRKRSPIGVGPATASGRMAKPISTLDNFILQRKVVHIADLTKDQRYIEREPDTVASVELGGVRTVLAAPMLKDNEWVGVLVLSRQEVRSFTDNGNLGGVTGYQHLSQRSEASVCNHAGEGRSHLRRYVWKYLPEGRRCVLPCGISQNATCLC